MAETRLCLAQNIKTGALTQVTGYNFSSIAQVGRATFGANEDGVFQVGGADFNGTPVVGYGEFYLSMDEPVRCSSLWIGLRVAAELSVSITTDDRTTNTYTVDKSSDQGSLKMHGERVFLKPHLEKGQYIRVRIGNTDTGDDFRIHRADLHIIPLGGQRTGT